MEQKTHIGRHSYKYKIMKNIGIWVCFTGILLASAGVVMWDMSKILGTIYFITGIFSIFYGQYVIHK